MKELISITKALADESRVRALFALRNGELCVCHIIKLLALAPSTVSRHMAVLRQAGLVESRKDGRWIYYRLPESPRPMISTMLNTTLDLVQETDLANKDRARLETILKENSESQCRTKPARRSHGG